MVLPLCSGDEGFWHDGRVSACVSRDVLGFFVPLAAAAVSLVALCICLALMHTTAGHEARHYSVVGGIGDQAQIQDGHAAAPEPDEDEEEEYLISWLFTGEETPRGSSLRGSQTEHGSQNAAEPDNEGFGVRFVNNDAYEAPQVVVTPSPTAAVIEALAIFADALVHFSSYMMFPFENTFRTLITPIIMANYLFALVVSRIWSKTGRHRSTFQKHSFTLYAMQWFCLLVSAHSSLVQNKNKLWAALALLRLAAFTTLLALHATAPRQSTGNQDEYMSQMTEPAIEDTSSLFSLLTFSWMTNYVVKGQRSSLGQPDLGHLGHDQKAARLAAAYRQTPSSLANTAKLLIHFLKGDIFIQGIWAVSMSIMLFAPAELLRAILTHLDQPEYIHHSTVWLIILGIFVSKLLTGIATTQCDWAGAKLEAKLKGVLLNELMAKATRRSSSRWFPQPMGAINQQEPTDSVCVKTLIGLIKVDADVVSTLGSHIHVLWLSGPVQVLAASFVLFNIVGMSGLAGVACSFALLPLYPHLLRKQTAAEQHKLQIAETRSTLMAEFVSGIRIIKYYAWEACFQSRVSALREAELTKSRERMFWWSVSMTVGYSMPLATTTVTLFLHCFVAGHRLTAATFFPTLAAFAALRAPLDRLSDITGFFPAARASMLRITEFLTEPDVPQPPSPRQRLDIVGFEGASFRWTNSGTQVPEETEPLLVSPPTEFGLTDVSISFAVGKFNAVVGHRGAGKSSLLLALLGEMELVTGRVHLPVDEDSTRSLRARYPFCPSDSVAYCAQTPWIQNDTLRSNITFGLPFDSWRYKSVLEAVALMHDLPQLQNGDLTVAGENGCCLSVSQRQRLALGRALYSTAKVVLIDDLLSALDNSTAKHVLLRAIKGPLMYGRTCIVATCQARMAVPFCDFAVRLDHGKVSAQGTPQELVAARAVSRNLLTDLPEIFKNVPPLPDIPYKDTFLSKNFSRVPTDRPKDAIVTQYEVDKLGGTASWAALNTYIRAMGPLHYLLAVLGAFAAQQALMLTLSLWATTWIAADDTSSVARPGLYVGTFAAMVAVYVLSCRLSDVAACRSIVAASRSIHERLVTAIFHATFGFLEQTPTREILRRFTNDVDTVDQDLAALFLSTLQLSSKLAMSLGVISVIFPLLLPAAAFSCLAYVA
ncbi:hypothetical protein JDV02_000370 [Purpureocillium takamizusanense]|uniref:ABC transporter n=1 Tax=Purpureocillium takamizusanense TaxID=2060973 RepID=A0A9Q8Q6G7_9HYPO|nr:uncharacterized protein JDV02_000370 [Purpureocillium takamizusanense]UNI13647.1 hypothetical protein JDV02_000370 [Purpureocillium takamizusanense]